jgi:hypothetical protein
MHTALMHRRLLATPIRPLDIFLLACCLAAAFVCYQPSVPKDAYGYDESDYMFAASRGFVANYFDQGVVPFNEFVRKGIACLSGRESAAELSQFIRASEDISFYRHYHGPLYFYGLSVARPLLGDNEHAVRATSLVWFLASVAVVYIGSFFLISRHARLVAIIAGMLLLTSNANISTAVIVTPHNAYLLVSTVTLFLIGKLLETRDIRFAYAASAALALSFLSIEYAPLLAVTFLICIFVARKDLFANDTFRGVLRHAWTAVMFFLGTLCLVWPGGVFRLTLVKNYAFFVYYAMFRADTYGENSPWELWSSRVQESPMTYTVFLISILAGIGLIRRRPALLPFFLYAAFILIATMRIASFRPSYISSLFPALALISGIVVSERLDDSTGETRHWWWLRPVVAGVLSVALVLQATVQVVLPSLSTDRDRSLAQVVDFVRQLGTREGEFLVDQRVVPTLHYYVPSAAFTSFSDDRTSWDELVDNLDETQCRGILYAGREHDDLMDTLAATHEVSPCRLTDSIVYYEMSQRKPK